MKTDAFSCLLTTLSLLLTPLCWNQSAFAATPAEQQWTAAEQQLRLSPKQRESGLKEITRNCVPTPIPTTPSGPSWTFDVQTSAAARLRGTAWRVPCGGNDAQLILTLQPVQGTPFVCGTEMEIMIGAARTDDLFLDTDPNDGQGTSFCSNLPSTASFVIHEFDSTFAFDDDAAFTLVYESDVGPDASIAIPAFDPALYAGSGGNAVIAGKLSGSYYSAARNGEGILVEIGSVGARRVLFLSWYTYFQGQQRWIVGSADLTAGATSITVPLVVTTGGQFGSAFDPNQVVVNPWGSAVVQFPSCAQMRFQWSATSGESGSYDYARGMDSLDGIACP
ncbi:MAG: hypothetical protein R3F18_20260 [Lysobacterales bacterium]|nr:hypothetical protein [Xanthomonadales bacterium]